MLADFKERHSPRRKYLVGVSGGRDSVALLELLGNAGYRKLVVCHFNHGLRGRQSGQDAAFVRRLAEKKGFAFELEKVEVAKLAKQRKISVELAAREGRLEFFAAVSAAHRCPRVILGHHADDQVETIIMNLFRGAGAEGLEGMRECSSQNVEGRDLELIRPLLGWWREDIDSLIEQRGLSFREDLSNRERTFLRNRVRHELVPSLARIFGRDVRAAVARLGELSAGENAFFRGLLEELPVDDDEVSLRLFRKQDCAVQRRWAREWLRAQGIADVGCREVEEVRLLAVRSGAPAKINLSQGRFARRRAGVLFIE